MKHRFLSFRSNEAWNRKMSEFIYAYHSASVTKVGANVVVDIRGQAPGDTGEVIMRDVCYSNRSSTLSTTDVQQRRQACSEW